MEGKLKNKVKILIKIIFSIDFSLFEYFMTHKSWQHTALIPSVTLIFEKREMYRTWNIFYQITPQFSNNSQVDKLIKDSRTDLKLVIFSVHTSEPKILT